MEQLALWKVVTDALLVLSMLYLSIRVVRTQMPNSSSREMRDLEITLKTLLRDADMASRSLGESLNRKQESLETILGEIRATEARVNKAMSDANDTIRSRVMASPANPARERQRAPEVEEYLPPTAEESWAEPPSFEMARETRPHSSAVPPRATAPRRAAPPTNAVPVNIYGEPINAPSTPAQPTRAARPSSSPSRQRIAEEIEIERSPAREVAQVAREADEVLKASRSIARSMPAPEQVVIPAEPTQMEESAAEASTTFVPETFNATPTEQMPPPNVDPSKDPRLGVFGIKRQVQVI